MCISTTMGERASCIKLNADMDTNKIFEDIIILIIIQFELKIRFLNDITKMLKLNDITKMLKLATDDICQEFTINAFSLFQLRLLIGSKPDQLN